MTPRYEPLQPRLAVYGWIWHFPGHGHLSMADVTHLQPRNDGRSTLIYWLHPAKGEPALFHAWDFTLPAGVHVESLDAACLLLEELCLRPTERPWCCTEEQRSWARSEDCSRLQSMLFELRTAALDAAE